MSKFEDEAMDVAENSHHNAAKLFGRGATSKGGLIDAKSVETGMLLEKIDKMAEVHNLLLDRFHIRNGSEGLTPVALQDASPCAHCSHLDHVEMDCPIMEIIKSRACINKAQQEDNFNSDDRTYRIIKVHIQLILITFFIIILCSSSKDLGGARIRCILHIVPVSNKTRNNNPTRMQIRFWMRSLS